jgi:hypothetical protein
MSVTVEVYLKDHDEVLYRELQAMSDKRGHQMEHTYNRTTKEHYYSISLRKDYWKPYKAYLMEYARDHLSWMFLELDRDGDCMDKNVVILYENSKFTIEVKTSLYQYKGEGSFI